MGKVILGSMHSLLMHQKGVFKITSYNANSLDPDKAHIE
jgi:hypothetical protein